jgi:dolichol kinase
MSKLVFEAKRKFIHLIGLTYVLVYYIALKLFDQKIALLILVAIILIVIAIEFFRIVEKRKMSAIRIFFRAKEENTLGGQVYYLLGLIIALAVFEWQIAIAVILMTVFGDMAAAIFGIAFGKHWIKKIPDTAWEGIIAEFAVDLIIGYLIIGSWAIVIPMAAMATFVETVFPHVDDNLAIPVFAGFIGQTLKLLFPL